MRCNGDKIEKLYKIPTFCLKLYTRNRFDYTFVGKEWAKINRNLSMEKSLATCL